MQKYQQGQDKELKTHFLSSALDVGWRISIKAAPNFYSKQRQGFGVHIWGATFIICLVVSLL